MSGLIDLTGQRFGRLIAIERAENLGRRTRWLCRCDCGGETRSIAYQLRNGTATSCGCRRNERAREDVAARNIARSSRGGLSKHPLYATWRGMVTRCADLDDADYGGRGIRVCPQWSDPESGLAQFIADVGDRPTNPPGWINQRPCYSLDRIDNDGNYEPGNVRWATSTEQAANRRPRVHLADIADWVMTFADAELSLDPWQRASLAALFEEAT